MPCTDCADPDVNGPLTLTPAHVATLEAFGDALAYRMQLGLHELAAALAPPSPVKVVAADRWRPMTVDLGDTLPHQVAGDQPDRANLICRNTGTVDLYLHAAEGAGSAALTRITLAAGESIDVPVKAAVYVTSSAAAGGQLSVVALHSDV